MGKLTSKKLKDKVDSLIKDQDYNPDLINVSVNLHREKMNKGNWSRIFDDALDSLSRDKELRGVPLSVLLQIISKLDYENKIVLCQTEIGELLGVHGNYVNAAIRKLVNKGILFKVGDVRRTHTYKLNIEYGWKGTAKTFNEQYGELKLKESLNKLNKDNKPKTNV